MELTSPNPIDMSIFIRSYRNDFEWLSYCVRSISKYCSGFRELVIAVPNSDVQLLPQVCNEIADKIVAVRDTTHGYIAQQITKLQADQYCKGDLILFVDSDCFFHSKCTPDFYCKNGLPVMFKETYNSIKEKTKGQNPMDTPYRWKRITEEALKTKVCYEYMRLSPHVRRRKTLETLREKYPNMINYCNMVKGNGFSEFNVLGAVADFFHPELYSIQNVNETGYPATPTKQYRSWDGLTDSIRQEMESFL